MVMKNIFYIVTIQASKDITTYSGVIDVPTRFSEYEIFHRVLSKTLGPPIGGYSILFYYVREN